MSSLIKAWGFALLVAGLATSASAAVLFDNGGASVPGSGGTDLTQFIAADDFVLLSDGLITGGTFDYNGLPTSSVAGLAFYVYADVAGVLYHLPGAQLATGALTVTDRSYLGDPGFTPHSRATFGLSTPFAASGGVRYWFGLRQFADVGVGWTVRDFGPSHTAVRSKFDDPGTWRLFDFERPFTLTGPGVPEPAAWALMILGFGGIGALARRRAQASA